ncbi:glycotransferase [Candidatus Photodesmus katoptron]|nr:glycotransferase [Candidatus Photodesmus katoptron]
MESILVAIWIISITLIIYHHIGYPLILKFFAIYKNPINQTKEINISRGYRCIEQDKFRPSITIIVPVHNEMRWIADKIRNLAIIDYPKNKLKVIIACDGCQDKTIDIAEKTIREAICHDTNFEIRKFNKNHGKASLLNKIMHSISSNITAFSDTSSLISIDALLIAEQSFEEKKIGFINSTYYLVNQNNIGETTYWQYQNQIKNNENSLGLTIGAHGAFYLFRTHLFENFKDNTINDDFVLPMEIIKKGYRANRELRITAIELEKTDINNDFKRRIRISAGNMQQAIQFFSFIKPQYKGIAFAFFSGKILRLAVPYLMIVCLINSIALMGNILFITILIIQILVYALALLGYLFPGFFQHKFFLLLVYFVVGHYANFIGGIRYLLGLESKKWTKVNS